MNKVSEIMDVNEVDFQNNSMGGWTHIGRPEINHHMNVGQDIGILSQTQFEGVNGVFVVVFAPNLAI